MGSEPKLDEVGYWSEIKLEIVKKYAVAYSKIMASQSRPELYHIYIDAFAGAGVHISRSTSAFVAGSPLNALIIEPPFREYHFIDLDGDKIRRLQEFTKEYDNVHIYEGDCNEILIDKIFTRVRYKDYRRALCLLDPYGLHLDWEVVYAAGSMKTIDIFLNFPLADINRNVLLRNPDKVRPEQKSRLSAFWGDDTWRAEAYEEQPGLFFSIEEKVPYEKVVEAFRQRLKHVAGFAHVPQPLPMTNSRNAVVYYLFFASPKAVAHDIVEDIFRKYRDRRTL